MLNGASNQPLSSVLSLYGYGLYLSSMNRHYSL